MAPPIARRPTHDQLQDQAISNLTKNNMRLASLSRASLRLGQFQDQVLARAESWQIAARNVGSAYATAAKMHTDALAKQEKIEALKDPDPFLGADRGHVGQPILAQFGPRDGRKIPRAPDAHRGS